MAEIYAGPKLFILPGIRYEYTSEDFVGRNVRFAPNGTWLGTDPIGTTAGYGVALPGLHRVAALDRLLRRPSRLSGIRSARLRLRLTRPPP